MNLQVRVDGIRNKLPEGYDVYLERTEPEIVLGFEVPGIPKVESTEARYLAIHYMTGPKMPGVAKFNTVEEAFDFLDKFEQANADYEKVLRFAGQIHVDGWRDAIYAYAEDADELPAEADEKPYWVEMPDLEDAELVTTVNASTLYGSYSDIAQPDGAAILVKILADVGGESEIELAYLLEALEIEEDSLEEYLALQLVCHFNGYAYVRRDLMAAVWLLPVPENLKYLGVAVESEDFKNYYDEDAYVYNAENINERRNAIEDWLYAVREEADNWRGYDEEDIQEFNTLLLESEALLEEDYV